ncbi:MAG: Cytochrome c1 [Holosporales bacterium]
MNPKLFYRKRFKMRIFFIPFLIAVAFCEQQPAIEHQNWSFNKWNGTFDRAALQRGFQVYKEVCAACHALKHIRFRELKNIGFSDGEIKALAQGYEILDGPNDDGEMFKRPGEPKDALPWVFKNEKQARSANNGALPVDLSMVVKARKHGADYVYALLTSYKEAPKDVVKSDTQYWNEAFPGHLLSMAPPLTDGQVTYADGTKATIEQMAKDVTTFLAWAAEPEMETRKQMGINALIFLCAMTIIFYLVKRRIWKDVK